MGRRGPPPSPSAVKKLRGTYRKDRAARNELTLPPGVPSCPDWLDAEGRAEWERVVPLLADKVLTEVDRSMLADYCAAHSLAVRATKAYQKDGVMLKTPFGPQKNPMVKVAQEARAQARLLAGEFGLSPASRTRVGVKEQPNKEDEAEAFFFQAPRLVK